MVGTEDIKILSDDALAALGMPEWAYVKRVTLGDGFGFAIHAADGAELAIVETRDVAYAMIRQHEMEPVAVH